MSAYAESGHGSIPLLQVQFGRNIHGMEPPKYFQFKLALEAECWCLWWRTIRKELWWELPVIVSTAVGPVVVDWPDIDLASVWTGLISGFAALMIVLVIQGFRFALPAPYRLWKRQHNRITELETTLKSKQPRVSFDVGNADEYVVEHAAYYMFKITNHQEDSDNCLVRLLSVTQNGQEHVIHRVLPNTVQWEEDRRGPFNLRQDEPKYVMLIGNFPDGWRFLLEHGLSDPYDLTHPVLANVAVYGCGPVSTAIIAIELIDPGMNLLRLFLEE